MVKWRTKVKDSNLTMSAFAECVTSPARSAEDVLFPQGMDFLFGPDLQFWPFSMPNARNRLLLLKVFVLSRNR